MPTMRSNANEFISIRYRCVVVRNVIVMHAMFKFLHVRQLHTKLNYAHTYTQDHKYSTLPLDRAIALLVLSLRKNLVMS